MGFTALGSTVNSLMKGGYSLKTIQDITKSTISGITNSKINTALLESRTYDKTGYTKWLLNQDDLKPKTLTGKDESVISLRVKVSNENDPTSQSQYFWSKIRVNANLTMAQIKVLAVSKIREATETSSDRTMAIHELFDTVEFV